MDFVDRTVVVTGGAQGIGAALVAAFEACGATVWALDVAEQHSHRPERFLHCNVADAASLKASLDSVVSHSGDIDIFVSNAGIMSQDGGDLETASVEDWARCWSVNVMPHVYAAKTLLPAMTARKSGYFVIVASAAGLLNQIGDAPYSATKHAAVSFAESLAIEQGDNGIGVSLVCPQYVATPLIGLDAATAQDTASLLTADEAADCVLRAVSEHRFLVLPHPDVRQFAELRARDHDRWIRGMRKLRRRANDIYGRIDPVDFYKLV